MAGCPPCSDVSGPCNRSPSAQNCATGSRDAPDPAFDRGLARLINRYGRIELLIVEELGYIQFDTHGAELFFQVPAAYEPVEHSAAVEYAVPYLRPDLRAIFASASKR